MIQILEMMEIVKMVGIVWTLKSSINYTMLTFTVFLLLCFFQAFFVLACLALDADLINVVNAGVFF